VDIEYNVTGWFDRSGASESVVGMVTSWQDKCSLPLCLALLRFFSVSILTSRPQGQSCGYSSVTHTHSISNSVSKHQRVFCSGKAPLSRVIIHSDEEGLEDNSLLYKHPLICQGKSILSCFRLSYFQSLFLSLSCFYSQMFFVCLSCMSVMSVNCAWVRWTQNEIFKSHAIDVSVLFKMTDGYGFVALVTVLFVCMCVCVSVFMCVAISTSFLLHGESLRQQLNHSHP
jgi:hypothetical protein